MQHYKPRRLSRVIAGKRAQRNGADFEAIFDWACTSQGIAITRIPDGCKQLPNKLIRVKSPFDWVLSYNNKTAIIDTKTIDNNSFPHSKIDSFQVGELIKHPISGYIVWLRDINDVLYIPAHTLNTGLFIRGSITNLTPNTISIGPIEHMNVKAIFNNVD